MTKRGLYILSFLVITATACKNSDDGYLKQQLIGEWEDELYTVTDQETNEELSYTENYRFYEDSEFIRVTSVHSIGGEFVGYKRLTEGRYAVSDKDLSFNASTIFKTDEGTYANTIQDLRSQTKTIIDGEGKTNYRMEFTNNFNSLTLYFECPPYASCVPYPELERLINLD